MRWVGHEARMGENTGAYRVWWERGHLKDPGVYGRIILRRIFRKWYDRYGLIDLYKDSHR
jgi:hypothetical protein